MPRVWIPVPISEWPIYVALLKRTISALETTTWPPIDPRGQMMLSNAKMAHFEKGK